MKTGRPAPTAMKTASKRSRSSASVYVLPMIAFASIFTPAASTEPVDLGLDDVLGQAELGDAVDEHAAGCVERLEDRDVVAALGQLTGGGQAGRPGADDGDRLAGGRCARRGASRGAPRPVGDEALEVADGDRLALLAAQAEALALRLLRADAPGDAGQRVVVEQRVRAPGRSPSRRGSMKRGMLTRTGQPSMQYGACTGGSARPRARRAAR
jgi:hypothetical protein